MKIDQLRTSLKAIGIPGSMQDVERLNEAFRAAGLEPGEYYQTLEMDNRYVNTHRDISFSNSAIHLHSHDFYELICCRNTCGVEYLVGTKRYRLQKGDILFVAPGVSHRPILPENLAEPYERDVLWISKEFARTITDEITRSPDWIPPDTNLVRTAGTRWELLAEMFHAGVKESENKEPCWEMAVIGNTMALVSYLLRALHYQTATEMKAEAPDLLDRVMGYIELHLSEKITLSDTARYFYVSESTISHLFRQRLGVSFYRCVTQRRLIAAKELIWRGLPLETVAEQVGFTDYSSFFRAFKQEYNIPPKQYRKSQGVNPESR